MPEQTRIEFERSGGFANVSLRATLDGAELQPEEVAELDRIARGSAGSPSGGPAPGSSRGADRFQFDIDVVREGERLHLTLSEDQVPSTLRPLIDRLVDRARRGVQPDTPTA